MTNGNNGTDGAHEPGRTGGTGGTDADWRREERELEERSVSAARLFDVRRVIGFLFVIYGILVTLAGIFVSDENLRKAQDININLWTGLAMLALGLLFLLWLRLSPTVPPPTAPDQEIEPAGPDPRSGPGPGRPGTPGPDAGR